MKKIFIATFLISIVLISYGKDEVIENKAKSIPIANSSEGFLEVFGLSMDDLSNYLSNFKVSLLKFGNDDKEIISKLKAKKLPFEISKIEETKNFLEIKYIVNGKNLIYTFYKSKDAFKKGITEFDKDDFLIKVSEEKFKKNYKLFALSPIIDSPVYGRWNAIVGENQIIKASGNDYASANDNIIEFFDRLQDLKNK